MSVCGARSPQFEWLIVLYTMSGVADNQCTCALKSRPVEPRMLKELVVNRAQSADSPAAQHREGGEARALNRPVLPQPFS